MVSIDSRRPTEVCTTLPGFLTLHCSAHSFPVVGVTTPQAERGRTRLVRTRPWMQPGNCQSASFEPSSIGKVMTPNQREKQQPGGKSTSWALGWENEAVINQGIWGFLTQTNTACADCLDLPTRWDVTTPLVYGNVTVAWKIKTWFIKNETEASYLNAALVLTVISDCTVSVSDLCCNSERIITKSDLLDKKEICAGGAGLFR